MRQQSWAISWFLRSGQWYRGLTFVSMENIAVVCFSGFPIGITRFVCEAKVIFCSYWNAMHYGNRSGYPFGDFIVGVSPGGLCVSLLVPLAILAVPSVLALGNTTNQLWI